MKSKLLFVSALIVSLCQAAQAQSLDNVFRAFSKCDASFFKAMREEAQVIQPLAPTDSKGDAMWIKVPNRKEDKTGTVALTGKPTIVGIPVVGYLDESSELDGLGRFYYWGFKVQGTQVAVLEKLKPLVHDNDRLRKDAPVYVRTELNSGGSSWQSVKTSSGVPKKGTVERAFLFEEDEKDKNITKVFCSLQGSVEAEHLKELRPDIDANDYPKKPEIVTFEGVNIASELMTKLQGAVKDQPLFLPKFKKAVIAYKTVSAKGGFETTDTLIHSQAGVLDVLQDSRVIKFKRQYIGNYGLFQTKYGFINQSGQLFKGVLVAKDGNLEFAKSLVKGEMALKATVIAQQVPVPDEKDKSWTQICTTGDTIPASDVFSKFFSKLPGRAILLNCVTDGKTDDATTYALIEDYGLVLRYDSPEAKREFKVVYTNITIER